MTANHSAPAFALIMLLTGIGIPILAALNGGLGTRLGSPMAASMILFGLAFLIATAGALITGSVGQIRFTSDIPPQFYFGGLFVAFYVIAVTFIAPKFGVGNAIFFVLVGQLVSAATIDHFGLFGA
ncbi:MAG: DMT family transporter, partial [Sphingopyxis sp.]